MSTYVCDHTDEYGNLDMGCYRAVLDAESRGYQRGFADGLAQLDADCWAAAQRVARNVTTDRARSWEVAS